MGLFDGLFGGDKPDGAGGASSFGSKVGDLTNDPIFMAGLQIFSNGLTRRPISQARSPLEGVPQMLAHFGDKQQEKDALKSVLLQSGYSAEEAERMARNPAIARLAIDQKNNANADAALAKAANGPSMFGGGMSAAPSASPAAKVASGGEEAAPSAPASFGGSQQEFIASLMPKAMEASKATGVDPRIIVAQAALESGWGKSAPGNNLFGIKSHGQSGGNTLATTEVVDGKPVRVNDSFRAYASPEDSVKGYADFINTNPRYGAMKSAQGLDEQIAALQKSGYATDPNYGAKIKQIAAGISLPGASPAQAVASSASPQGGQGLSRLPDSAVQPPAPGVPVASRGPDGALAYSAPQMTSDLVQRGTPPGDPSSYASTSPARPLPAGVDPASLAQPAVQGRVQVASSDPSFVPGGTAPDDQALKPATIAEGKKAIAATPPPQPNPNVGASTQRAQAIQVFNHWSKVLPVAGRYGEKGKGLMKQAEREMDLAQKFLEPTEVERLIEARRSADPAAAAMIEKAMPNNDPTNTREYDFYSKQEAAAGRAPKSFEDWDIYRRRAQNQNETGSIPAGYKMTRGADGSVSMTPIPGSPADREAKAAEQKEANAQKQTKAASDMVTQDIDRAIDLTKTAKIPVTGGVGNIAQRIPGTAANDVAKLMDGIKANIAFDRVQQMRANSPTGAALGSVSDNDMRLLQAVYGSLEQSQTQEQFERNLKRLKTMYLDVVHNVNGDAAAGVEAAPGATGGIKVGESKTIDGVTIKRVK